MLALPVLLATIVAAPAAASAGRPGAASRFTWSARFPEGALDRSEARVQAAIVDAHEDVVIAGSVVGRLQIGRGAQFSDDHHEKAFLAKIDRAGRVTWFRGIGSVPSFGMLMGYGATALLPVGDEILAIGDFSARGDKVVERAEPSQQLIARFNASGRLRDSAPLALPAVLTVVPAPDRDLYVGGCTRQWTPPPGPGLSPILEQTGGFVARISPSGTVRWRKVLREPGTDLPPKGKVSIGPVSDCTSELLPARGGGVTAGGMFNRAFRMGPTALDADEGTFLAQFSAKGDLLWARTVATRLATTSYDVRPQFGALPDGGLAGTGIVPTAAFPSGGSGAMVISPAGKEVWSRPIEVGTGCCNVDSPLATSVDRDVLVAGIATYGEPVSFGGRSVIVGAASNAFTLWVGKDGSPVGAKALPESATELSRVGPGRRGAWVIGTHRNGSAGTGIFVQWVAR